MIHSVSEEQFLDSQGTHSNYLYNYMCMNPPATKWMFRLKVNCSEHIFVSLY